jgi:hypothetical protein
MGLVIMTKNADATDTLWNNAYIAYIPLLGAAVALTYDVGYFYAVEISFFTLFSLSEHIVFAIQAFPFALVVLIPLSAVAVIMGKEGTSAPPPPYDPARVSKLQRIAAYALLSLIILLLISVLSFALLHAPETILIVIEYAVAGFGILLIAPLYKRIFIVSMAILIGLTLSFLVGYSAGTGSLSNDDNASKIFPPSIQTVNFKNGAPMNGRIIRSGDRGVLLYDPASNRIRFVLWEAIGSIEATPQQKITGGR